jgi:hypothetical protein
LSTTSAGHCASSVIASGAPLRLGVEGQLQILRHRRPGHAHRLDAQLQRLRGEQFDVAAAGAQRDHPEPVRVATNDVDGLGADGTGGAEQDDVTGDAHGAHSS